VRKQTQTHERTVHSRNVSCGHESQGVDEFPAIAFVTIAPQGRCWPAASNPLQNLHVLDYPRTPHRPRGCSYAPQLFRRSEKHYHYYHHHQRISQSRCSMQAQVPGGAGVLPESLDHSAPACLPAWLAACLAACLPVCLPGWLPACLSACLPGCLSACLPSCLPACRRAAHPRRAQSQQRYAAAPELRVCVCARARDGRASRRRRRSHRPGHRVHGHEAAAADAAASLLLGCARAIIHGGCGEAARLRPCFKGCSATQNSRRLQPGWLRRLAALLKEAWGSLVSTRRRL